MDALYFSEGVSSDTDKSEKQGKWSELPLLPIEKVYSYLSPDDQVSMSVVCQNWSEGYSSPSLWKNFRFNLTESQLSMDTCPLTKFVLKYGSMFQHVEIRYPETTNNHTWCKHLIDFLQHITVNSQLISVKFLDFVWCYPYIDALTRGHITRAVADFLRSQNHLKKLVFADCFDNFKDCVELLKELNENSRNSIVYLGLGGLDFCGPLEDRKQEFDATQGIFTLSGLERLTLALEIEYSLIFENIIACQSGAFKTSRYPQRLVLSKIIIYYDQFTDIDGYEELKSFDWKFLTKLYPDPQVQLELIIKTDSPSLTTVECLIGKNMPITRLNYTYEDSPNYDGAPNNSPRMEIDELFDHLLACKTNEHLVSLNLHWILPIPNLASAFIRVLQACKKMKCLDLFIKSPVNGLCLMMESWLGNRPESLKEVHISIAGIDSEDERTMLINSTTESVCRLKSVGFDGKVDVSF